MSLMPYAPIAIVGSTPSLDAAAQRLERLRLQATIVSSFSLIPPAGRMLTMAKIEHPRVPVDAIVNLVNHQQQCDEDGVMVQVSRQALAEVLVYVTEVRPDNKWADTGAAAQSMGVREALQAMENACEAIAARRTTKQYLSMIDADPGISGLLTDLDMARHAARTALAAQPPAAPVETNSALASSGLPIGFGDDGTRCHSGSLGSPEEAKPSTDSRRRSSADSAMLYECIDQAIAGDLHRQFDAGVRHLTLVEIRPIVEAVIAALSINEPQTAQTYFVKMEDHNNRHICLSGMEAWGECWSVIRSPSGDVDGDDAEWCGFFIDKSSAEAAASALSLTRPNRGSEK